MMWRTELDTRIEWEDEDIPVHVVLDYDPGRPADRDSWQPEEPGEMEIISVRTERGEELIERIEESAWDWIEQKAWREIEERLWEEDRGYA